MDPLFWIERWKEQMIGFHQDAFNPLLQRLWPELGVAPGGSVLVPLCGKSLDMLWLRDQGLSVTGVELSEIAIEAFFSENGLTPERRGQGTFARCEVPGLRILCGDFFDLDARLLGEIQAVYDRASLIALPPPMRRRFVDKLNAVLPADASMLLITVEYPQDQMSGPPFSVEQAEVEALFAPQWDLQLLYREDVIGDEPRFRSRGLSRMFECVYRLQRKPHPGSHPGT